MPQFIWFLVKLLHMRRLVSTIHPTAISGHVNMTMTMFYLPWMSLVAY